MVEADRILIDNKAASSARIFVALLPLVALAVVPALDSPFLAAKAGLLLLAGAFAALILASHPAIPALAPDAARPLRFAALACCGVACISLFASRHWAEAWPVLAPIAAAACVFLVLLRSRASAPILLAAISLAAVGVALLALAGRAGFDLPRLLTGTPAPGRMSASATLGNPMFVASFLAASFWSIFGINRLRPAWRYAAPVVIFAGMVATAERTAAVAFVTGAIAYLLASSGNAKFPRRAVQAVAILLAAGILFNAARVGNPRTLDTALRGRIFLWSTALRHITLFGGGPGSFYRVYNQNLLAEAASLPAESLLFVRYEIDAHCIAVQSLAEFGVAGFFALAAIFALWFRAAWKRRGDSAVRCAIAGVAAFLAAGLVDDPLARPEGLVLLAFWLAVPLISAHAAIVTTESRRRALARPWRGAAFASLALALMAAAGSTLFASYAVAAGDAAESRADWSAAQRWDRVALRVDPASRDARFNLVRALCQSEQYAACFAESERALAWVNEAELHLIRLRALEMLGRAADAQQELLDARREFPWSADLQHEEIDNWPQTASTQPIVVELTKE
jgi:O-antigen ligase/polysaccharide polymerase Wzy-like membrane protein